MSVACLTDHMLAAFVLRPKSHTEGSFNRVQTVSVLTCVLVTVVQGASLAASCAALCVQHCAKLQDAVRGETTVLDIGCGTGGCCFELAARYGCGPDSALLVPGRLCMVSIVRNSTEVACPHMVLVCAREPAWLPAFHVHSQKLAGVLLELTVQVPLFPTALGCVVMCSFSHVLGIDGDLLNITAAKELKAQGELCFRPVAAPAAAAASPQQQSQQPGVGTEAVQEQPMCVIHVPDEIDRDRVRWVVLQQLRHDPAGMILQDGILQDVCCQHACIKLQVDLLCRAACARVCMRVCCLVVQGGLWVCSCFCMRPC